MEQVSSQVVLCHELRISPLAMCSLKFAATTDPRDPGLTIVRLHELIAKCLPFYAHRSRALYPL